MISSAFSIPASDQLLEKIGGGWLGKSIGGTLGLPAEGKAGPLKYSFYDPVPTIAPPNDDLELQLVWLHVVENASSTLTQNDFATAWLNHIHYMWDEYGCCRWNLRRGVPIDKVGTFENPFHAGMGSPIRSEIWACLFPGDPDSAAYYAALDASLDHGVEGIAGEVLFAVLQSKVIAGGRLRDAIQSALGYLPKNCETTRAVELVRQKFASNQPAWSCWKDLVAKHGSENFTYAPLNVALTIWALLYGEEDFEKSILLAVNGGYDTDCTAATVGATLGFILGKSGIPSRWIKPIGEGVFIGPGIQGVTAPKTLSELTDRTCAQIGKLKRREWSNSIWDERASSVQLDKLPGTIRLNPAAKGEQVMWANGELPAEIKRAGGAHWTWRVTTAEPRVIICLARDGANLYVDDKLIGECPAGLPNVPAPHRSPSQSRFHVHMSPGNHSVWLKLNSKNPEQEATVILAYPNFHLCPWTELELPNPANLAP